MSWYAIRSIFHFEVKDDGHNVFEERVVVFEAGSEDEAFEKAEKEASEYAINEESDDFKIHPDMELFIIEGDSLNDGCEVWSTLLETRESMDDFYTNRYKKYEYFPPDFSDN